MAAEVQDSLQTLELRAVVWSFKQWPEEKINVVTYSLYVSGLAARIEEARLRDIQNQCLFELLRQLQVCIHQKKEPYAVLHIQSHKWREGLGEGNARADQLVTVSVPISEFTKAREAHATFHQNARGLHKYFNITMQEARGIGQACPTCSHHGPGLDVGVNPRGLGQNEVWQMDVTHVSEFGRLKYVHDTIDTFSHFIWATAQTREKALHVI